MTERLRVTVSEDGDIHIPDDLGLKMGITPGMALEIEAVDDTELRVHVTRNEPALVKKGSVLVVRAPAEGDLENAVDEHRSNRLSGLGED